MRHLLLSLMFTILLSGVFAQDQYFRLVPGTVITEQLDQQIKSVGPGELIQVNITLNQRANSQSLMTETRFLPKAKQREYVVAALKEFAAESQKGIMAMIHQMANKNQVQEIKTYWIANVINCKMTPEAIQALAYRADIESIDFDEVREVLDPRENRDAISVSGNPNSREITWNVLKINADDVWALGFNGDGVVVAVIDTGVNYNHTDLQGNLWEDASYPYHGFDFVNNDNNPLDDHGHGTHCAGTVAGNGASGSQTGVAPGAKIMCLKVLDGGGGGQESDVWDAIQFAIDNGAHVISMSLGWQHSWGPNRSVWRQSFDNALAAGVASSVAAGNEGDQQGSYPIPDNVRTPGDVPPPWLHPDQTLTGGISGVICVGSTTSSDQLSGFSSRGPLTWSAIAPYNDYQYQPGIGLIRPDISAPGSNIKSLAHYSNTGYEDGWSGTSMATPANAGVIALMLQKNPTLDLAKISQTLENTAYKYQPNKNNNSGSGRIDALAALNATSFPGPSYHSHAFNDLSGNGNGMIDPSENILVTLSLANFSDQGFSNVTATLSTESSYITITDNTEDFGNFSIGDIVERVGAFAFTAANNIPGGHVVKFNVSATDGTEVWTSSFTAEARGVNLVMTGFTISDQAGNNNGRLDPGENATITVTSMNSGQISADNATATLSTSNQYITISNPTVNVGSIAPNGTANAAYNISVAGNAPIGEAVVLDFSLVSGYYTLNESFGTKIGIIVEDFETGNFNEFDWTFAGNAPWTIVNSGAYEGTYAAKSGSIGDNQATEMKVTMDVAANDSISFYRKVSSESSYDFLEFYIDNTKKAEWSGEVPWGRVAYAVTAGTHTFRWRYMKDVYVVSGSDCGWVDYIEFPAVVDNTLSIYAGADADICVGNNYTTSASGNAYTSVLWSSSGTGTFVNATALNTTYNPSQADYTAGSVTLTLTAYGNGGATATDQVLLTFSPMPLTPGTPTGDLNVCQNIVSAYTTTGASGATSYAWTLNPPSAGSIIGNGATVDIDWDNTFTGTVSLQVRSISSCGQSDPTSPIFINIYPVPAAAGPVSGSNDVCQLETVVYNVVAVANATSYSWVLYPADAGSMVSDGTECHITWSDNFTGNATIKVCGLNNCGEGVYSPELTVMVYNCTGITEVGENNLTVQPNPSSGLFTLTINTRDVVTLQIVDLTGRTIYRENNIIFDGLTQKIMDVQNLTEGVYYLTVTGRTTRSAQKLIITK